MFLCDFEVAVYQNIEIEIEYSFSGLHPQGRAFSFHN